MSAAAVYTVVYTVNYEKFQEERQTKMEELTKKRYTLQQQLQHPLSQHVLKAPLTEEEAAEVKAIVESDDVIKAILQVVGEADTEVFKGPADTALYKYTSEEWVIQVTVNLETQKVMAVSMNKGRIPLIVNPQNLVQIAEREFHTKELGTPFLKKVYQSDGDGEVIFLTDEGTITVKIDLEEGKVIEFEKTSVKPSFRWFGPFFIFVIMAAVAVAVVIVLIKRKSTARRTEKPENIPESKVKEPPQ